MDAFTSTFLPKFLLPNVNDKPIFVSPPPQLYVSCARIEGTPLTSSSSTKTPNTTSSPTTSTLVFNAVLGTVKNLINPPLSSSLDPRFVLSGNFAPVDELPPTDCEVIKGSLPPCLDGAYIRNGPNPQYFPDHDRPYHLFDGDGMVHCVRISKGRATLSSRYVKTYKYNAEREAGFPIVPSFFSSFNGLASCAMHSALYAYRILTGQYNPAKGIGLANTGLALIGNRLFALGESDLPYEIRLTSDGDIETLGRHDFDRKLFRSMTAHPKVDSETGETFAFRYSLIRRPFLTYFYFDANGKKQPDAPILNSMASPSFIHDFAITKTYAIFPDIQIRINPMKMVTGMGSAVSSDPTKLPRIGIIPLYSRDESEMKWFDVPGFNPIHVINAWDEDDGNTVVMVAPNVLSIEHSLERMDLIHALVEKVRIDLKTGLVTSQPISKRNLDFAVINPAYVGKRNKYVYAAVGNPMPKISGVVKLDVSKGDLEECTVGKRMFERWCYGGEPFFVPKEAGNPDAVEEDDGYVLSFVHDENKGESSLLVMDAKSANLDIVAEVKMPQRVPYGFHGLFVTEDSLRLAENY